ncbi:MAG: RagB/SusD family nutrient uptake outer membrane protein [Tannerella sp.]|jgi:hypothetical protein|nr:RagB/SusD family nutrient uptake outer membrane protein [Tannerella sp.]
MNRIHFFKTVLLTFAAGIFASCADDFLDRKPLTAITPEVFYTEESQLAAFPVNFLGLLPSQSYFNDDRYYDDPLCPGGQTYYFYVSDMWTDNQANFQGTDNFYYSPKRIVGNGDKLNKCFEMLYRINYFLETAVPRMNAGALEGNRENIRHYIGEAYLLRAWRMFLSYACYGDMPIVRNVLPDRFEPLVEASRRQPRNEVARFILSDLDSAAMLMKAVSPDGRKQRPSKYVAQIMKSRVALFEATWLKYFKGTAFVPGGPDWPGAAVHSNYQFPAGSIEAETDWFLEQAMTAAQAVADANPLVENSGLLPQSTSDPANRYFNMLCNETDYSGYSEVLLWREFSQPLELYHNGAASASSGNDACGMTRALVESFVMKNGLPIYADGSGYAGDDYLEEVAKDRDDRLRLWLKLPGQVNILWDRSIVAAGYLDEPVFPHITLGDWSKYITGYASRKGATQHGNQYSPRSHRSWLPSPAFRSAEAMLNYIEACYEKNGSLDGKAQEYWRALRTRAGVDPDFNRTIAATDMQKEAATGNWAVWSGDRMVDATLFNIRRERNSEMWGEDLRKYDIRRWRSLDNLINTPCHIEGFKIWGPMKDLYGQVRAEDPAQYAELRYGTVDATVSDPADGKYLRPYRIYASNTLYNGFRWKMAWYLYPIGIQRFVDSTPDGDLSKSPLYQNPGWGLVAGREAEY